MNIYLSHLLGITGKFSSPVAQASFFKAFYAEIACIILLLAGARIRIKSISRSFIIASSCCLLTWIIQLNILWNSDDFMSFFLLENIGSISLILHTNTVLHCLILTLLPVSLYLYFFFSLRSAGRNKILGNLFLIMLLVACFIITDNNRGHANKEIRDTLKIQDQSPGLAFINMIKNIQGMITEGEIDFRVRRLIRVGETPEYPMLNETLYSTPFPFPLKSGREKSSKQPNVIVFFVESLSARKLSPYKTNFAPDAPSAREDLTPNIARFAHQAMTVEQYFSHTFSTFRGLRGQNCSMFPYYGGDGAWSLPGFTPPAGPYRCLPHHLHVEGYETIFFGPDNQEHCHFSFQTKQMGFKRNIFRKEIEEKYLGHRGVSTLHLTDQELMQSLITLLQKKDMGADKQPFYLATYPKGCHVGLDYDVDGRPYNNGKNQVYNTIHNWDRAFGLFWDAFQRLNLARKTILIMTGDHSHWPERPYIEIAGSDYNRQCFGELGLLIYSPLHELPRRYNADQATSLGFAPMITQILGLNPRQQNSFLGISPFEQNREHAGVGWANRMLFLTESGKKPKCYNLAEKNSAKVNNLWQAIRLTHLAELNGKMIYPQLSGEELSLSQ
ncbi:MAG: sulfatase-like hydrolase/transferase [Candidatus Electrothrix communis]|nr:MAG: sulfatase-like hydrolase/transferase [Candidatus Electrothrix communis]